MALTKDSVIAQSKNAYNQWRDIWRKNAEISARFAPHKSLSDFMNIGVGKACLLVANGYTFERHIDTIKEHQGNVDIMCCDKTLGHLLDNGIKPTYCIVCDANVNYEKYMKKWESQLEDTILFINVCANQDWSLNGNWKDKYFFVNFDSIKSELEFGEISKCQNGIPAATNVSNAMAVFLTQSDNSGRKNYFGYDKLLLIGYDYSWTYGGKYYAFNEDGDGKAHYMRHIYLKTRSGKPGYTSTNLHFSASWAEKYFHNFKLPVILCDEDSILGVVKTGKLEDQMQYSYRREDAKIVRDELKKRDKLKRELAVTEQRLVSIGQDHYRQYLLSL